MKRNWSYQRLRSVDDLQEGKLFNVWMMNRFNRNKNILTAVTGQTGSGKSYQDLRRAELWYQYRFKCEFPTENICFSIAELMQRITSGNLKRGEILIFEEAGANFGSLDFQTKISKVFGYVLQSFRSMNIGIFFNLPHLSMLNKQARMLIHVHFATNGIQNDGTSLCKAYFRQVNQSTGKIYGKYMKVKINNGAKIQIKEFRYHLPSDELRKAYENKKAKFLQELTTEFTEYVSTMQVESIAKVKRKDLTENQKKIYEMNQKGFNNNEIAEAMDYKISMVSEALSSIRKKGYEVIKYNTVEGMRYRERLKKMGEASGNVFTASEVDGEVDDEADADAFTADELQ